MVFPPVSRGPVNKVFLVNHVNPIQYFRSLPLHVSIPKTLLDWFQWQTMQLGRSAGNKQISVAQTAREKPAADIRQREKSYIFIYIGRCITYCCPSNTLNAVRKGKERTLWISEQNRAMAGCRAAGGAQEKQTQYISTLSPSNYASV